MAEVLPTDEERIRWYLTKEWPLQLACCMQESLPVVKYLYNQNPVSVSTYEIWGGSLDSLFGYYSEEIPPWKQDLDNRNVPKQWENISVDLLDFLLEKYPAPLRGIYVRRIGYPFPPLLFDMVQHPAPLNIVQLVHKKNPAAIRSRAYIHNRQLPLHVAVRCREARLDVVEFLVHHYPASVRVTDRSGNLPLHVACCCLRPSLLDRKDPEYQSTTNLPVVKFLRNENPSAVNVRNGWGDLPFDGACRKTKSLELLQLLVDDTKPAARSAGDKRPLPLHFAILSSSPLDTGTIQRLVEIDRTAVAAANEEGDLPLHLACQYGASLEVIQLLLEKNVTAVNIANNMGFYPLQLACGSDVCLDALLLLLKSNPVILSRMLDENHVALKQFLHEIVTLF